MPEVPSWIATAVAALIGFLVSYAALRATVTGLKEQVVRLEGSLERMTTLVGTLQAQLAHVQGFIAAKGAPIDAAGGAE